MWNKFDDGLRAVIEVKRAWNFGAVSRDGEKLAKYLRQKAAAKTGYVIVYSEFKGRETPRTVAISI